MVADQTAPQLLGVTAIKPVERHGFEAVSWFFYDKNTGAIMGRTPKSWALILIFYVIYYACLAAFWAMMFAIFWQISIDLEKPRWTTDSSLIGSSPGMGVRPAQSDKLLGSSMIVYRTDVADTSDNKEAKISGWKEWEDRAVSFLKIYPNLTVTEDKKTKEPIRPGSFGQDKLLEKKKVGKADKFFKGCGIVEAEGGLNATTMARDFTPNMGFQAGQPCILVKLNRIIDLEPAWYNDTTKKITEKVSGLVHEVPQALKDHISTMTNKNQVWVDCHGEWPLDMEKMGGIEYYPKDRGFSDQFFPYMKKQDGYNSPLVAVKFLKPPIGQLLHIECRAWAHNINYDRMTNVGKAHFELLVHNSTTAANVERGCYGTEDKPGPGRRCE